MPDYLERMEAMEEANDGVGTVPCAYGWIKYLAGTLGGRTLGGSGGGECICLCACNFRSTTTLYSRLSKVVASINEDLLASDDA